MNRIKKYVLGATIFILTICSTSFANSVSWDDFTDLLEEQVNINIKENATIRNDFYNAKGFFVIENNNNTVYAGGSDFPNKGNTHIVLLNAEQPIVNIQGDRNDRSYKFRNNAPGAVDGKIYTFNNGNLTAQYTIRNISTYDAWMFLKYNMENSESIDNFFNENNSKYFLNKIIKIASNVTFMVRNPENTWSYSLTVTEMKKTPFPWEKPGGEITGGDNIIYDYTDESFEYFKKTYFKPYLEFNAPINGYVDYTGNWDKGKTWEIDNTTYKDNEFYLYMYSGDGSISSDIYNGYIYLDVYKANYITSGDINYTYYKTKKAIPDATYIKAEEISENVMKYTFTLKRCFNDEGEINHNFNEGWLNDLSGDKDYIFRLRFEDSFFDITSKTSWFYFNLQSPLNLYRNTSRYNIPKEYTGELPFGYGGPSYNSDGSFNFGGGGFRDENGNQIIETSDFNSILNSTKAFLSNFLGFFDIFPSWLNTLIALGLTVAVICRIIGR